MDYCNSWRGKLEVKINQSINYLSQQNLGPYFPLGQPTGYNANSGNAWTQVVLNAGGTVPQIAWVYGNVGSEPHFAFGSGNAIGTSYGQQLNTAIDNKVQTVLNSLLKVVAQLQQLLSKANGN